ncbi:WecB/TagA/CpsF family glycosyltransferase [Spirulina subsalsa FACHB-351]|uniref:WecB/TagA/CpsF family glycosyltransferase n=1 Tax=Spirulina subsalsa FACHB-351 TaxID=234711 RepID=A0ABT3L8N0_9CYAN|nr:WecB/TagA/CpsF family glycosyltransferase [Spirulina subsalsa]MCW6037315.1 WecB/TagA/CpsF family glycosyltransferase [Spirulina subsalsa FACHB-351]
MAQPISETVPRFGLGDFPLIPSKRLISSSVTALRLEEQVQTMLAWAQQHMSKSVCVANVHMLMEAHWHPDFAQILNDSDLVTPDGMPLVWMLRLLGATTQDRVAGMDILLKSCTLAQYCGVSVYFVGSHPEILAQMREKLQQQFPQLEIAGMEPLPFRPITPAEDSALIAKINQSGAGLVFVSLGCPKQERWIAQHKGKIQAVMVGLGGVFPVYAGLLKHAPEQMRQMGLEWLYRLVQEPQRLWKRYTETIPPFLWLAAKQLCLENRPAAEPFGFSAVDSLLSQTSIPIGQLLYQAGLLSEEQITRICHLQAQHRHLRFGELLVQQGWLRPETVDFFVEQLPKVVIAPRKQPLGYYLKSAALLDSEQIQVILQEQSQRGERFGEMAVQKGWLKPETLHFFLNYLVPESIPVTV